MDSVQFHRSTRKKNFEKNEESTFWKTKARRRWDLGRWNEDVFNEMAEIWKSGHLAF